jgi:hypothetical protein
MNTASNTWPGGRRRALSQSEHEAWNANNYPGTRALCHLCDEPTGDEGYICPDCADSEEENEDA